MTGKRGQNEGSIYKRKDGRWTAALSVGGTRRKTFYGKTRQEVQEKLTAELGKKQAGLPIATDERQTVGQFLDHWLKESVKSSVRPKTYDSYAQLVRLHLKPRLGHIRLSKLTPQLLQAELNWWLKKGRRKPAKATDGDGESHALSPRTVQYLRAVLRRALVQAVKWNLVSRNVATLVDPPRSRRQPVTVLTPEQAKAFVKTIKGDRMEPLYLAALTLGLREGEVLGLRWQNINFESGTLRVEYGLQRIEKKLQLVPPKTERSRRTLKMPAVLISAFRAHRVRQLESKLAAGSEWQEMDFVFATRHGTPLDARNVLRNYYAILAKAELPRMTFHHLRHSCASLLLAQNVPARVVMEVLGHSQISLTLDTYSHVMPALMADVKDAMDRALES